MFTESLGNHSTVCCSCHHVSTTNLGLCQATFQRWGHILKSQQSTVCVLAPRQGECHQLSTEYYNEYYRLIYSQRDQVKAQYMAGPPFICLLLSHSLCSHIQYLDTAEIPVKLAHVHVFLFLLSDNRISMEQRLSPAHLDYMLTSSHFQAVSKLLLWC